MKDRKNSDNKRKLTALIAFIISATILCLSAFAWFYFPSAQNLIIKTAPDMDLQITLYHMETNENGEKIFKRVNNYNGSDGKYKYINSNGAIVDSDGIVIGSEGDFIIDKEIVYFQWGYEYICESEIDDYYAIEIIYDDDTYDDGYFKAILNAELSCYSDVTYINSSGENTKLRFRMVTVGCAFSDSANTDLSKDTAVQEALNLQYVDLPLVGDDDQALDSYDMTGTFSKSFVNSSGVDSSGVDMSQMYRHSVVGSDGETTHSQIRLILYVKVSADSDNVTNNMPTDITALGNEVAVNIKNKLKLSALLRSVPKKTE